MSFSVVAVPLNRPEVIEFLLQVSAEPQGVPVQIISQRPTRAATAAWRQHLARTPTVDASDLLLLDEPRQHLVTKHTDRLVPNQFLQEPGFLTRNLGGWTPIYFGVINDYVSGNDRATDPFLAQAIDLQQYGERIPFFGADEAQVKARLYEEVGGDIQAVALGFLRVAALRQDVDPLRFAEQLYATIAAHGTRAGGESVPRLLLLDALLDELVQLELARRAAVANGEVATADMIGSWFAEKRNEHGLQFILKGEYIVGRHRRSTVVIAPELGVVVKQPAPEPFHEVVLGARTYHGQPENWPRLTEDGSLVTSRGRVRLTLEEDLIPRLNRVFHHPVHFSTLLGLIIEPYVAGPTTQELVLRDASQLTPSLYDGFVLHQQVCEAMGIENGDWHSANFIVADNQGRLVHVDWGAARPLRQDELTSAGKRARLDQVRNIAYSFQNETLAERTLGLHAKLVADEARLNDLWRRASEIAARE
jgi:hypothetical protein